jgi:hypothetical protein
MHQPLTNEEKEFFEIQKAKFKVKNISNKKNDLKWRLYKKGFLGIWWLIDDYKYFLSVEETIKQIINKKSIKDCEQAEKRNHIYYNKEGIRVNKKKDIFK